MHQGSNATGDCCSKCWASIKPKDDAPTKKEGSSDKAVAESAGESQNSTEVSLPFMPSAERKTEKKPLSKEKTPASSDPPRAKKKKKKASYKSMMAGMTVAKSRDIEKEKEKLKEVTGGGHFQKIDKI